MSTTLFAGLAAAVACALLTNLAFLLKHQGACAAPAVCFRSPLTSARALFSNRVFLLGMGVAVAGFIFHALAMALAPLTVVKPVIAGGLVFLAVLAEKRFGHSLSQRQWGGIALVGAGLALLALTVPSPAGTGSPPVSRHGLLFFESSILFCGVLLALAPRAERARAHTALLFAGATGLLFGASDVAIKALSEMSPAEALLSPWLILCLVCAVGAFLLGARSLQLGDAVPTIAITCLASNLSAILGGFVVFGDPLPSQPLALVANLVALGLIVAATALVPAPTRLPVTA
jgi:multidrug transporter EmrE-like cation transporter